MEGEDIVLNFLMENRGVMFSVKEVSREADYQHYKEDPRWARGVLMKLCAKERISRSDEGFYFFPKQEEEEDEEEELPFVPGDACLNSGPLPGVSPVINGDKFGLNASDTMWFSKKKKTAEEEAEEPAEPAEKQTTEQPKELNEPERKLKTPFSSEGF